MKKIFVIAAICAMCAMIASCGTTSGDTPDVTPDTSPSATSAATAAAAATPQETASLGEESSDESSAENKNVPSNNETQADEISIINGTSVEFYDLYISENTTGNLGENIINGETLGEGEEIVIPYANIDASKTMNLIAADADGRRYVLENLPLSNGAVIELRLNGSALEAVVQ